MEDVSDEIALLALQGPLAPQILASRSPTPTSRAIKYYHFADGVGRRRREAIISRTGYTGEDGFELYFANDARRPDLERAHRTTARSPPPGSARATRCASRWGWRSTATTSTTRVTPLEANLGWIVKLPKGDFIGRDALVRQKERGRHAQARRLHDGGARLPAPRLPGVVPAASRVGVVCSGTMSPTLEHPDRHVLPARSTARRRGRRSRSTSAGSACRRRSSKLPFYKNASAR